MRCDFFGSSLSIILSCEFATTKGLKSLKVYLIELPSIRLIRRDHQWSNDLEVAERSVDAKIKREVITLAL